MLKIVTLAEARRDPPSDSGRPDWDTYFTEIAFRVADRGDCTRAKVGAVIVDTDHRIISTGYNGTSPGESGCLDGACPRGRHYPLEEEDFCTLFCGCGKPWPCKGYIKPGEGTYDDCIALHAEVNAVVYAGRVPGGTIYVTREPCGWCRKVISAAGITTAVFP